MPILFSTSELPGDDIESEIVMSPAESDCKQIFYIIYFDPMDGSSFGSFPFPTFYPMPRKVLRPCECISLLKVNLLILS